MILESYVGPLAFIGGLILMYLVVPWERIKSLAWFGLIGGLGMALVLLYMMQNYLGFWTFDRADVASLAGIPLFLSAAWIPAVIVFAHFLAQYREMTHAGAIMLAFPLGATFIHYLLIQNGMLAYFSWNLPLTFLVSLGIHLVLFSFLYATGQLENLPGHAPVRE